MANEQGYKKKSFVVLGKNLDHISSELFWMIEIN